ncbi:K02A2.6-like [Cordylochernes scorpioides]|uniref:K02A2.6-like n=1 Tax=Cordylochernes scorpioides TaxID=51811 RepID=A0ABY6K3E9_9ARAC|nr:K02A2.6-like [Cordylochernes scorpioides]
MISKAKNRLKILKKISGLNWGANANILRTTYLALVKPILEYATPAWINASKTNLSKIDRIQASAAKIISGLRGSCPNRIAELESNLLSLHLRRKICFSKFITKKINSPKEHLTGKFIRNWVPNQRLKRPTPLNMAHNSNLLDIPINPKHRTSYPPHKTRTKLICFPHLPDNPHKHETQPELLKALGLQIIEENSSLFDITIYTDGSQLETGLSGSGIAIYKDKILEKISLSHPRHLSVYKSELSAIDKALKDININSPSKIIIYSDSRAAIYTLQSCFSSQEPLLKSIAKSVNRLPDNSSVTVQWLPAHVGIPGNELADSLAKAGALGLPEARESTTQLNERDLLRQCQAAFIKLKNEAASDRVLIPFDTNLPVTLTTDASPVGIAAVLSHGINKVEHLIAFASRSPTDAEQNYSQLDREALAIVFGVDHFFDYLFGHKFTLITDNQPIPYHFKYKAHFYTQQNFGDEG